jgi:methionyl aminopeptidase
MVIDGERYIFIDEKNKWTVYTEDGSLAAHYENTVIVNDSEPIITTLIKK